MSAPHREPRPAEAILQAPTRPGWAAQAIAQLDATLADHAHCEKKAAASAIALINDYPEDRPLVEALGRLVEEEIGHFREVYAELGERSVPLDRDGGDPYVRLLLKNVRQPPEERKLDRLLVSALIEARSCERFRLLKEGLAAAGQADLSRWFQKLESSEAGHAALFVKLARDEYGAAVADARLTEMAAAEAAIVQKLPHKPRIH